MQSSFKIKWNELPVADLNLANISTAESIGDLSLVPQTENDILLEILCSTMKTGNYRRSGGPTALTDDRPIPLTWGPTSYEDIRYLMETQFLDPWSFELSGDQLPPVEESEIEGVMIG